MNKKNVMIFFLVLAGLFGLMWWGRGSQSPTGSLAGNKSQLSAAKTLYDFGTISMSDGKVSRVFRVINPTDREILVSDLTTSCMCTAAYILKDDGQRKGPFGMPGMGYVPKADETIGAGETREIEVVYDPNAHGPAGVGLIDRFVYLRDTSGGTLQLEIKARVTP